MDNAIFFPAFLKHSLQILQILCGCPAAVISHSPEKQRYFLFSRLIQEFFQFFRRMSMNGIVIFVRSVYNHFGTVEALPAIILAGKVKVILCRTADHIGIKACLIQNLHQAL
jgi:hypothetical protein